VSLISSLTLGRNALTTQQAAIQVTSNNISNAGNADYTRETAQVTTSGDQQVQPGIFIGTGVNLSSVNRQVDNALLGRLRSSVSDQQAAATNQQWLSQVESTFNELSDNDISTKLSTFFNSWSSLANNPNDSGLRQVVLNSADSLASSFKDVSSQLGNLQSNVSDQVGTLTDNANSLTKQVADLNGQIAASEGAGGGQASGLRDQRDAVLKQLSQLVNINTVEDKGTINVYIGSQPLVTGNTARALSAQVTPGGTQVTFKDNSGVTGITGGQLGGLIGVQSQIAAISGQVDSLAGALVFDLNKIHSASQGLTGASSFTASNAVSDPTAALNSAAAGLPFPVQNGSFTITVHDKSGNVISSGLVKVDLVNAVAPETLNSLAAELSSVPNVTATISNGKLTISSVDPSQTITFGDDGKGDSSNVLAALGINSFFAGKDAGSIGVNTNLVSNPSLLAASNDGSANGNKTALAIAQLETTPSATLNGQTIEAGYQNIINGVANSVASAKTSSDAASAVQETLQSQRDSLSGVSLDEESVNLIQQQRAFEGAARIITTIDEMLKTVLAM
jgi:flagellar hook-associated protein 1